MTWVAGRPSWCSRRSGTWRPTSSSSSSTMPGMTFRQATVSTETTTAVSNTVRRRGGDLARAHLRDEHARGASPGRGRRCRCWCRGCGTTSPSSGCRCSPWCCWRSPAPRTTGRLLAGLAGRGAALVAAVVLLGLLLRSQESAARIGSGAGAGWSRGAAGLFGAPAGARAGTARPRSSADRTVLLLHARWHWITLATLVSHLSLFAVLLLALRFVGVDADEVEPGRGAGGLRLRPAADRDPVHPGRPRRHRGRTDHRAGGGGRRPGGGGGGRADLPGAHLRAADPDRPGHLRVLAAQPARGGGRRTPRRAPNWCRRRCDQRLPGRAPGTHPRADRRGARRRSARPCWCSPRCRCTAAPSPAPRPRSSGVLNGTTVLPFVVVWPVMQLGNVLVVPASAAARRGLPPLVAGRRAAGRRRRHLPARPRW